MTARAAGVALLAAATLAFEILLVRVFAIEHFHHLAYMAIGVAMLGIGASGSVVAAWGGVGPSVARSWFLLAALFTAVSLIFAPMLLELVSLDLTQLAWNPRQWLRFGAVYLVLALPFALGALAILLAITAEAGRPGRIYGASFLGSGAGALLALGVLWIVPPSRALAMPAFVAALAAAVVAFADAGLRTRIVAAGTLAVSLLTLLRPPWDLDVSPYKALPQIEAYPGARRVAERVSPLGWLVAVQAPAFRHAPGLSLGYTGDFPPQTALLVDGELAGAVTHWATGTAGAGEMEILDWLPSTLPHALGGRERVLVIGAEGGMEVWAAAVKGARRVIAVETNSSLTRMSAELAPLPTSAAMGATIEWVAGNARAVIARTPERFDLITLSSRAGLAGAVGGMHALNEDFLHTTDAYRQYLNALEPGGVLAITGWISVPQRGAVRTILTAVEALREMRPEDLDRGILVARSWGTFTVLVKPSGFSAAELDRIREWARSRQLDLDWQPGTVSAESEFNIPHEPTLTDAARAALAHPDSARQFAKRYAFAVAPVADAQPYPHRFVRAGSMLALLRAGASAWLPFAEWGYIALVGTLVQSVVLAAVLILLPAAARSRRAESISLAPLLVYFSAIGVGYMAAEIAIIQQLTLLLGHPVYAVAAVLAAILICSGLGSVWSDGLASGRRRPLGALLGASLGVLALVLLPAVHALQGGSLAVRGVTAAVLLAPIAAALGTMFPLGLRAIAGENARAVAWAWAANGFASVVAVPLSALITVELGSPQLLVAAAICYFAAVAVASERRNPAPAGAMWFTSLH